MKLTERTRKLVGDENFKKLVEGTLVITAIYLAVRKGARDGIENSQFTLTLHARDTGEDIKFS